MIPKKEMRDIILKDFDKKENLQIITNKLEERRKKQMKNNVLKYAGAIGFFAIAIVIGLIVFNNQSELKPVINNGNDLIYINSVTENSMMKLDADVKEIGQNVNVKGGRFEYVKELEGYEFYKNLLIPNEYNAFSISALYVKSNQSKNNAEYDKLNNYIILYKVKDNDKDFKEISISFSKENKPLRDYYFSSKNEKKSNINGTELDIYQYEKSYFTIFTYENINFDIETYNVGQEELISLLKQIIK